jgi:hypothetical protein
MVGYITFSGDCSYCGQKGHKAAECFKNRDTLKDKNDGEEERSNED